MIDRSRCIGVADLDPYVPFVHVSVVCRLQCSLNLSTRSGIAAFK
jgi:hypothetical protein